MKRIFLLLITIVLVLFCSCTKEEQETEDFPKNAVKPDFDKEELDKKFGTDEIYIVKTYSVSPSEEISEYLEDGKIYTMVKHYQLSDGSWKTDDYNYKYKLVLKGRLNNAVKDSTYEILSNSDDITFDMAWKASGLSSNSEDYFEPEDAIIVAIG